MDDKIVYRGRSRTIEWAIMPDGKMPGLRGWNALRDEDKAKVLTTIRRLGDSGECRNEDRFKHERNKIYAIKAWKVRIYCFMTQDRRIVLTNVEPKKQRRASEADLDRAERIRTQCTNG
ncbi:MAG: type II toxin-antitoxin system RelE/ParE family toxin [Phycisphaerales bacterium]|nr:MAG: type II toxin-antitoxin system RelE/ParE family toxin [Phycisphaerales bacterium]